MYQLKFTRSFKKSFKRYRHQPKSLARIEAVLLLLQSNGSLPEYGEHTLSGRFAGLRECHVEPDLLLLYYASSEENIIVLQDIGTHSYIFG